jgi:hypothetical protein
MKRYYKISTCSGLAGNFEFAYSRQQLSVGDAVRIAGDPKVLYVIDYETTIEDPTVPIIINVDTDGCPANTATSSRGFQGFQGPIGPAGPTSTAPTATSQQSESIPGPAGDQGFQGPIGPQGNAGRNGDQGPQGPAGSSSGNISGTVEGSLIPDVNEAYDLGSAEFKFRDLYLSGNTLYMGGQPLSIVNGQLTLNGQAVSGSLDTRYSSYEDFGDDPVLAALRMPSLSYDVIYRCYDAQTIIGYNVTNPSYDIDVTSITIFRLDSLPTDTNYIGTTTILSNPITSTHPINLYTINSFNVLKSSAAYNGTVFACSAMENSTNTGGTLVIELDSNGDLVLRGGLAPWESHISLDGSTLYKNVGTRPLNCEGYSRKWNGTNWDDYQIFTASNKGICDYTFDGNTVVVASYVGSDISQLQTTGFEIYKFNGTSWSVEHTVTYLNAIITSTYFDGCGISISHDGSTLVYFDGININTLKYINGSWSNITNASFAYTQKDQDRFSRISLSKNGSIMFLEDKFYEYNVTWQGPETIYDVYGRSTPTMLTHENQATNIRFGYSNLNNIIKGFYSTNGILHHWIIPNTFNNFATYYMYPFWTEDNASNDIASAIRSAGNYLNSLYPDSSKFMIDLKFDDVLTYQPLESVRIISDNYELAYDCVVADNNTSSKILKLVPYKSYTTGMYGLSSITLSNNYIFKKYRIIPL